MYSTYILYIVPGVLKANVIFHQCALRDHLAQTVPSPAPVLVELAVPMKAPVYVPLVTMVTSVRKPAPVGCMGLGVVRNVCVTMEPFVIMKQDSAGAHLVGPV